MKKSILTAIFRILALISLIISFSCTKDLKVSQTGDTVSLENELVSLRFDLHNGCYNIRNLKNGTIPISGVALRINDWPSNIKDGRITWEKHRVSDEMGNGLALDLLIESNDQPGMVFSFTLYEGSGFFNVSAGIKNTGEKSVQVKEIYVIADGKVFDGVDVTQNFAMIDGFSGGEPLEYGRRMYFPLTRERSLKSRNNILLTFGNDELRNTLVLGGLTYSDYEKYAYIEQSRRIELEKGLDDAGSLLCYLNLPDEKLDNSNSGESLSLMLGDEKKTWQNHEFRCTETATSVMGKDKIIIEARGLKPGNPYYLGLSWWRGLWHGDRKDHRQSIIVEYLDGNNRVEVPLVTDKLLPRFDGRNKEDVEQLEIPLPEKAIAAGKLNIIIEKTPDNYENSANDPNAYLSEIWLRDGKSKPLLPDQFTQINDCKRPLRELTAQLFASDPVGKRVDPGEVYIPMDKFYIQVTQPDPFVALEKYGQDVSKAQKVDLSMYDFPTVCLWYAENSGYGGGEAENNTLGAVNEMKKIAERGFLKYSRAAVRLVPDSYMPDNQQGWWDDAHWQREVEVHNGSKNGRYVEPYETSEKWGRAVTELGGIPLTYFQTGFRSEDYAKAYPEHMLFNKTYAWRGEPQDTASELFTSWNQTWARNGRVWGYDYTDPDFLAHMKQVYRDLGAGGVKGLMFDYPFSGWSSGGGMEDEYSTTAAAYRTIFRLPHDGLGPGSYVHERNMQKGSDVSIGYVASMRTENDTDEMDATTVTRCGLRWYKNRVLYNQDTDSKNIVRLEGSRDKVRAVLTMAYVTTGRLLLANSFAQFSDETYWDVTRTFPYHTENKSARPVDAFVSEYPMVYDFDVNPQWHQLTFYNGDFENNKTIGIDLAGQPVNGALGLNTDESYHIYDFWNDNYVGKFKGSSRLEQVLRPGEARMMSVHEVLDRPQVISTNRHIMQGYLDIESTEWNEKKMTLSGTSKVVGEDPYVITLAANGFTMENATANDKDARITFSKSENELIKIIIERPENESIEWKIKFVN